jgi:trk system potassium uptake protein TrkH
VEVSWFEAFFTATSALCVTGLTVVDTGSAFSHFGTAVILGLFQFGGLGMLLWSSIMIALLGGQLGLRHRLLMKDQLPGMSMAGAGRLTFHVAAFVIGVELLGAVFLWFCWRDEVQGIESLYYAFFHSASAFCNAGFALWPDSLGKDVADPVVNIVIISLVAVGSLGFAVVRDVIWAFKGSKSRLSVHSRLVLTWTFALTLIGAVLFFIFEYTHGGLLHDRSLKEQILIPLFHAGGRTAGLSTIDMGALRPETLQLMMVLMFIGGSPGSTAGGLKTTTVAILVLAAWSQVKGRDDVEVYGRRLEPSLVLQALSLTVMAFMALLVFALALNAAENFSFYEILFEATSALGIVGFSTGITAKLSTFSKFLICLAMIMGRVGPLTLAVVLLKPNRRSPRRFPAEDVLIG